MKWMKIMHDEFLRAVYQAFNNREMDKVLAAMHPDVDWPNGMEGGRVHGHQGVREYWTRQWSLINPKVVPVRFEEDRLGRVAIDVHQVVRNLEGGVLVDQMVRHVYAIEGGLIKSMDIEESPIADSPSLEK
jgi:hypothetical protein